MNTKKLIFLIIAVFISVFAILYIAALIINSLSQEDEDRPTISPTITPRQEPTSYPRITDAPDSTLNIPTQSPQTGGGVDLNAERTRRSIEELEKIKPMLPYYRNFTLSTGTEVSISISQNLLNARPWVLPVFIDGIDFFVPDDDPLYDVNRASFREAANITLNMLRQNGVDTSQIFINWGDQEVVQERAELWLR